MFDDLSLPLLLLAFAVAAGAVWVAGIWLSDATDTLSRRLGLGQALGGLIVLAVATNLPEIAITFSAARAGTLGVAVGNLLGGIAVQTVVLAVLDAVRSKKGEPLTFRAADLGLVLEALVVLAVLAAVVMGSQLPARLIALRITPGGALILITWVLGVWLVGKGGKHLPWHATGDAPGGQPSRAGEEKAKGKGGGTAKSALVFLAGAAITLVGGVVLERSGDAIAKHVGMTGLLFGATVLAAATSLPELSTGLASMKLGDDKLAVSDIFGGNAFLPTLFVLASVVSGKAVLPRAEKSDVYLTALGMLVTVIYGFGLILRPKRQILRMGVDSFAVILAYAIGIVGLVALSR